MLSSNSTFGLGRYTGPILGVVVFVCLTLIGFSGYVKYQLDRAESALAAPETALSSADAAPQRLRNILGYSGFVGAAQNYLSTRDRGAADDMKTAVKNAREVLAKLPEKTPTEARHDLQSILDMFAVVEKKVEQSAGDPSVSFTASDMAPLYAALPVLDDRAGSALASGRFTYEADLKLWATLLIFIAWAGLVVAAVCAVAYYQSLRNHNAAPFRALAQSVQNMARGDMRMPIWGMERQDVVGDLARAIDLARYHFSQLPDMSLLSEQGPIRIRFEGQARSLFEAMMQNIARDSETIRSQASGLADAVTKEKETVSQIISSVQNALTHMHNERHTSEQQVQLLLHTVGSSAQTLAGAQQSAEAQLGHLIAYLEERAKGMAEVTNIAGKQVAQTLQSLTHTEHSLRSSAEQNQTTVQKLAASTDELGERLFGAVSLLRAGGKVLTETAEETQGRLNEAISLLSQSEGSLRQILTQGFEPVGLAMAQGGAVRSENSQKLQDIVDGLDNAQRKLEQSLAQQAEATSTQIELLTNHSNSILTQAGTAARTLSTVTEHLRHEQDKLSETIVQTNSRFGEALEAIGGRLEQRIADTLGRSEGALQGLNRMSELSEQMSRAIERLGTVETASKSASSDKGDQLMTEIKTGFEIATRSIDRLREQFVTTALERPAPVPVETGATETPAAFPAGALDKMVEQILEANGNLARSISEQADRIERRLAAVDQKIGAGGISPDEAQAQLQQQAQILSELATALGAIDQHMQEMGSTVKSLNPSHGSASGRMAS